MRTPVFGIAVGFTKVRVMLFIKTPKVLYKSMVKELKTKSLKGKMLKIIKKIETVSYAFLAINRFSCIFCLMSRREV